MTLLELPVVTEVPSDLPFFESQYFADVDSRARWGGTGVCRDSNWSDGLHRRVSPPNRDPVLPGEGEQPHFGVYMASCLGLCRVCVERW